MSINYQGWEATPYEQYMLELINRARQDPLAEAARYGIDLNQGLEPDEISADTKPPVFMNTYLIDAARNHSQWMLDTDTFDHIGVNASSPGDRMAEAGYQFYGAWTWGENIAWRGTTGTLPLDFTEYIYEHHKGLFLSPGHRTNILGENFREIGIGHKTGIFTKNMTNYAASMITQNYAKTGSDYFIGGVIFQDDNGDEFYTPGEGWSGITVSIPELDLETQTGESGGYQLAVPVGTYMLQFSGGFLSGMLEQSVSLTSTNIKVDIMADENWNDWEDYLDNGEEPDTTSIFTLYSSENNNPQDLLAHIMGNTSGLNFISDSVNFIGADASASFFDSINFGPRCLYEHTGHLAQ